METTQPSPTLLPEPAPFRDAIRFWEPRRLLYNLVLTVVVINWLLSTWPHFRSLITLQALLQLTILAILANLCYTVAYLVDFPLQYAFRDPALKRLRWSLWVLGTLFAVVFANYWIADEIYPFVQ